MTKTAQIQAAIVAVLSAAGLLVRFDTDSAYSFETLPVVIPVIGAESPRPVFGAGYVYWDLSVSLFIADEGPAPTVAPEATRALVHAVLYADRQLGGLVIDIVASTVNRSIDQENPAMGITEAVYLIQYRQLESQL